MSEWPFQFLMESKLGCTQICFELSDCLKMKIRNAKFMQKIVGCLPSARAPLTDIFSETYLIVFNLEKHFLLSLVVTISVTN